MPNNAMVLKSFSEATRSAIGWYVYALTDPSDRVFYIGKGCGNRVFDHVNEVRGLLRSDPAGLLQRSDDDADAELDHPLNPKRKQIADILRAREEPGMYVIREGLTEDLALAIEAAVISVIEWQHPGRLTNQVAGHGTASIGFKTVAELEAIKGQPFQLQALPGYETLVGREIAVINVSRGWPEVVAKRASLLDVSRGDWKMRFARAQACPYAVVHANGIVRGVFRTVRWEQSAQYPGRVMFVADGGGPLAGEQFSSKNASSLFQPAGARSQNPVRYLTLE